MDEYELATKKICKSSINKMVLGNVGEWVGNISEQLKISFKATGHLVLRTILYWI